MIQKKVKISFDEYFKAAPKEDMCYCLHHPSSNFNIVVSLSWGTISIREIFNIT